MRRSCLLAGFSVAVLVTTSGLTFAQTQWDDLAQDLVRMQHAGSVPALGLVIFADRQPVLTLASGENITENTPFRWGSITKTFTAMALLHLAYTNDLDIRTSVAPLLGKGVFHNPWQKTDPVRLIHLAELTAGFPDLSGAEFGDNRPMSLEQVIARYPDTRRTAWPPGLQHSYSNMVPGLSSMVIEAVSGQAFGSYLAQSVLYPLGMTHAGLLPDDRLPGGFKADGQTEIPYWHMTYPAFGALNASLADMREFMSALLNQGVVNGSQAISPEVYRHLFTPISSLGVEQGLQVAYAGGMYGRVANGHVFHGHGGDADGYRSRFGVLPGLGRGYLVIINTDNQALLSRMVARVITAVTEDLPLPPTPQPYPAATTDLTHYAGSYYPTSARFGISRWHNGNAARLEIRPGALPGQLAVRRRGNDVTLIATGPGRFRRLRDPATTVIFARDAAGNLYLQGELGNYVNLLTCPTFIPWCNSQ